MLPLDQGWGTFFLPRAIWIFIKSSGAVQNYQLKNVPAIFSQTFNKLPSNVIAGTAFLCFVMLAGTDAGVHRKCNDYRNGSCYFFILLPFLRLLIDPSVNQVGSHTL